jgi:hypothetical protein
VPVKEVPHWRFSIRPGWYDEGRFPSASDNWRLIEQLSVGWRGWDFPHVDRDPLNRQVGTSWIAAWIDWQVHLEYWRFYESGQFAWLGGFWEDRMNLDGQAILTNTPGCPDGFVPSGLLDVGGVIYHLTELFEFASRLALRGVLDDAGSVEISLEGIRDRVLVRSGTFNHMRFHRSASDRLETRVSAKGLSVPPAAHRAALDVAVWLFERFGWLDMDRNMLARIQREFVEGDGTFRALRRA